MSSIYVIEDETAIRRALALNLEAAGHRVTEAASGDEAMQALYDGRHFDLALVDVMLPGVSGLELLAPLTQRGIPVIFLTARSDAPSRVAGLMNGAEDYIVKPFEVLELLVRIEKVLERTGKMRQVLEVADLTINLMERSVRKNGREIPLKPMEYDLLVMLAKNKNIALSRERLLHGVWGVDFVGETRTVDVHIGQLRRKLGLENHIRTVSKMGYRLEDHP